ncbi:MAG TPA: Trm112 family protein [Candidatus Krumholzibacteria bacterium]|nr:Trm112 family protein [Candidatus Krumholzibacteria bacterium]HPD71440.1 Trm112 family protein [Candidatus Krumholzibacteria bacterium]HRY41627.1 Trm112 family protein [Candidatus Krumholzibacteria bacterium]
MLDPRLLEILACPQCRGAVEPNADHTRLVCRTCRLSYRVEDDIPVMLIEEAESLEGDQRDDA